ncbi:MAG: Gfo/Idh/MocA family oxidoreductase [Dehalococcoidia bacterium]
MSPSPVRVAVLGYGYWGPNIVRTLLDLPGAELAVCCDASATRLSEARDRFAVPVTDDWQTVLADPRVDAVVVATPARTHREVTLACLAHDKHALVEKPFATSVADAEAMYEAALRRGLVLEAGHIFLHNPSVQALQREAARGALGELRTAFAVRASHGPRARNDVDVTFDCMVHDLYILHELLGPATEVSASGASFLTPGIADTASARISQANGAAAFCYASWYEPVKTRRMTLVGSRAMAEYDDLREEEPVRIIRQGYEPIEGIDAFGNHGLRLFADGERAPRIAWEEPLRRELAAFIESVRSPRREPSVSPESVLAVTRALEAIGRSMRNDGAPERVEGT